MYMCVCACIHICIYIYTYLFIYVYIFIYVYLSISAFENAGWERRNFGAVLAFDINSGNLPYWISSKVLTYLTLCRAD